MPAARSAGAQGAGPRPAAWRWTPLATVALTCAGLACAGSGADDRAGAVAGLPGADATPAQVARTFLAAWSADDRRRMRALSTEPFWDRFSTTRGVRTEFRDVRIAYVTRMPPARRGRDADELVGYRHAMSVVFDAHVRQRPVATWPDGRHTWGVTVVRDGAGDPWRVGSAGLG